MVTVLHNLKKPHKILNMPPEILIHILAYLEWKHLLTIQTVSRTFHELVNTSLEFRYAIELGADSLTHNDLYRGAPPLTTQDRLNFLLDRRRRWRTLDWTQKVMIPLAGTCQAYELVGGVFAKSMRGEGALGEDAWPPGSRHFTAAWLPTRDDFTEDKPKDVMMAVKDDLGLFTRDFAIDPTQDILVLLEVDHTSKIMIHVRALSTMGTHPLAAKPTLISECPPVEPLQHLQIGSCFLQVVGDIVGMFYWHGGHCLRVWNWQTGAMIASQNEKDLPLDCWDLTFLSPRAYMIACAGSPGSFDLYAINEPSSDAPTPPSRVLRLLLPSLESHRHVRTIATHSAPYLAHTEALPSPFVQHQNKRIHLVQLQYGDLLPAYTMYVKNEYLLDIMEQMRECRGVYHYVLTSRIKQSSIHFPVTPEVHHMDEETIQLQYLPWELWGIQNARLLQQDLRFQWLRYVNGYRAVMPISADELCVYDFNVHPRRTDDPCNTLTELYRQRQLANGEVPQWTYELVTEETELPQRDLFAKPVKSALPYAVSTRRDVKGYSGFMIDEQRLVGMKDNGFFNGSAACDIDVFTL